MDTFVVPVNVCGVRLGDALAGRDGLADRDGVGVELGERDALGEVLGLVDALGLVDELGEVDAEVELLGEVLVLGLRLALAEALALALALPEAAGEDDPMQIVVIGMHCSAIRAWAFATAPWPVNGNTAASMATQAIKAPRA